MGKQIGARLSSRVDNFEIIYKKFMVPLEPYLLKVKKYCSFMNAFLYKIIFGS
jgi:hypothetical protein